MWTANLFQVTTGAIGPQINFDSATWSISLNETESLSIDIRKSDLPKVDLNYWLAPWWAGILYMYNGVPIVAGPIISRPAESFTSIRVECRGIRAILERRFVITEQTNWPLLPKTKILYTGLTLGTIAQRVVKVGMAKSGGSLPISFPYPERVSASVDEEHKRTYQGYNLSNITVDAVLTKLSGVTDGPDIIFRPRLVDANTLTFDMIHGDDGNPNIPQKITPIWDTTAINGKITDLDIITTGTYQTNRVFATGDGTNEGTLIRMHEDPSFLINGGPLLETTEAYEGVKTAAILQSHAVANVKSNNKKLIEIQLTVRADGEYPLGTFWPGYQTQLNIKNWLSLNDGIHNLRLLNISGTHEENIRMSLQTEK